MSKVLWISDAGCTTGFGRVTHAIGERLVEDYGHEIHVLAVNYRGDTWPCERPGHNHPTPLRLYRPDTIQARDIYGMTRVIELLGKVEPEVVVFLLDAQVVIHFLFHNQYDKDRILLQYRPILSYMPDDGTNLPTPWTTLLPKITNLVAMSRHGQTHYQPSKLVYHGSDPEMFWPIWEKPKVASNGVVCKTRADCKRLFGLDPDHFLVGRVDTNSGRKDYPALIKALWPVMGKYSDIDAWFHCQDEGQNVGVRFQSMFSREQERVNPKRFFFPGLLTTFEGWPIEDLNILYSAFDCLVSTSRGEGFGLGLLEAAACGIPIVAQNVSAIPEVVGPGGILLEPRDLITTPAGHDNWLPDIEAFSQAIEKLYLSKGLRRDLGEAGAAHAKTFSWDFAAARFDEYVTALENYQPPEATEASEASYAVQQQ